MFDICELHEPETLLEAKRIFHDNPDLKVIAGGTDVLIRMQHGSLGGAGLLSLRSIRELEEIQMLGDGTLSIGAMAPFTKIFQDDLVQKHVPVLSEAAVSMGGPQVRNVATIGGNLCNGAVSADSASTPPADAPTTTILGIIISSLRRLRSLGGSQHLRSFGSSRQSWRSHCQIYCP